MSQSGGTPPIFKSDPAAKAVITLVLIENSQEMVPAWSDLRGHYLPTLLGTMRVANPVVPVRLCLVSLYTSLIGIRPDTYSMADDYTSRKRFCITSRASQTIQSTPGPQI